VLRLELSREADAELVSMLEYGSAQFGWDAAEAYVARFDQAFALLCEHPEIGAVHNQVRPPIRSWSHHSHRIFYDIEGAVIVVRRILHHSQDVVRWLG
jgi:toxin ParE1/3/4